MWLRVCCKKMVRSVSDPLALLTGTSVLSRWVDTQLSRCNRSRPRSAIECQPSYRVIVLPAVVSIVGYSVPVRFGFPAIFAFSEASSEGYCCLASRDLCTLGLFYLEIFYRFHTSCIAKVYFCLIKPLSHLIIS